MSSLLKSRKFWLAALGIVQTIALNYAGVPDDIWQAIDALIVVVIAGIAYEDGAAKRAK